MDIEGLKSAAEALAELRDDPWFPYPEAVDLLMAFGEEGVPDLVVALEAAAPRIRAVAARALGASESDAATAGLKRALGDPSPEVRRAAAAAIADRPQPRWVEPLGELLLTDLDETVRLTAAQILGQIGAPAVPALARALDEYAGADPWLPGEIVAALGQSGAPAAAPPLIAALHHPLPHVQQAAIEALTLLRNPSQPITAALLTFAADETADPYLRDLAAAATAGIESEE